MRTLSISDAVFTIAVSAMLLFVLLIGSGCAHLKDRGAFYTEQGLAAAEAKWHEYYFDKLDECKSMYKPKTPGAEACFRGTYEANLLVEEVVEKSVRLLRDYWSLRAEGYEPDFQTVARRLRDMFAQLPQSAQRYFFRVEGLR